MIEFWKFFALGHRYSSKFCVEYVDYFIFLKKEWVAFRAMMFFYKDRFEFMPYILKTTILVFIIIFWWKLIKKIKNF